MFKLLFVSYLDLQIDFTRTLKLIYNLYKRFVRTFDLINQQKIPL